MGRKEPHKPSLTAGCWQQGKVPAAAMVHHWRAGLGLGSQAHLVPEELAKQEWG